MNDASLGWRPEWMTDELDLLRDNVRRLIREEMLPLDEKWRHQQHVDRNIWRRAGELGLLCMDIPAEYGGAGGDFRHEVVLYEELARHGISGFGQGVHSICAHYVLNHGTSEQKANYLPLLASGEMVGAIGMTEPGAGSDLKGIRTRAHRDGDHYVVNGSKIFITNGKLADLIALVVRAGDGNGSAGLSILMVDTRGLDGYRVGRVLNKIGMHAQDTAELFFNDCRVPASCLLGAAAGRGMQQLMSDLPYERAIIAVCAVGAMEGALAATLDYVTERRAFGQRIAEFQHSRFKLAELATQVRVARVFADRCIADVVAGRLDAAGAAMAKWWLTDLQQQVIDQCLQFFGGYGYMDEYLIGRMYGDARVQRIYGGTNEIMKEVIARSLFREDA
ncbi:MAG: acyl-CoA dehydrogenase family protein [Steroidobacteraceae bacterium]